MSDGCCMKVIYFSCIYVKQSFTNHKEFFSQPYKETGQGNCSLIHLSCHILDSSVLGCESANNFCQSNVLSVQRFLKYEGQRSRSQQGQICAKIHF